MSDNKGRPGELSQDEWQHDLNPNPEAGQNVGLSGTQQEKDAPTAYDMKSAHAALVDFTDDDLKQIPILPAGTRLQQGATYFDLHAPSAQPFKARGDMEARPENWYVPKSEVDYVLWNRLTGVDNPERLDEADEA